MKVRAIVNELKEWTTESGGYCLIELGMLGAAAGAGCAALYYYFGVYLALLAIVVLMAGGCAGYLYLRSKFTSRDEQQD